ncbi:MAG: phosphoenolpyruvate--protein phosphotransferase [Spirochaetales bacterium]|nr:phosphoenolpyruvate--protein phosphotransferase [Spirochaetales bacterium]
MKILKGISASQGIAIGRVFFYLDEYLKVPEYKICESEIDKEIERLNKAIKKTKKELYKLKESMGGDKGISESGFLEAHILMLEDPELLKRIKTIIKKEYSNAEWALNKTIQEYIEILSASQDEYLRERAFDIRDVAKRLLANLLYKNRIDLSDIKEEVILVAHELLPSDTLAMDKRMVKGIATDAGGKTSHAAILARAFEIPAVLGLGNITAEVRNGDKIIVDGTTGTIIIQPDEAALELYRNKLFEWQKKEVELLDLKTIPAETKDGKKIFLMANIEIPEETESALSHGADGIGLYRSEFFFMQPGKFASEEEQYQAYSKVLSSMENHSVTIRTIDLGGDKMLPGTNFTEEPNPILGWRSIRFCMGNREIFETQLRALLRASVHGQLKIMFPMISGVEELDDVLALYNQVKRDFDNKGVEYDHNIPLGIMIEVPSAAMTADILARKVKFFSIGTNDLIQYTIAVDRGNEKVAYLYEPFHPGVLRLLKMVIEGAHSQSIPVSMCGEMAGDPYAAVILLGLGLDIFSMSSLSIPEIKNIIRSVSMIEAEELVGTIFDMKSYREIDRFVRGWMDERFEYLRRE